MSLVFGAHSAKGAATRVRNGAVAAVLALVFLTSASFADGMMLQVKDIPLREVVMLLMGQSGENIIMSDDPGLDRNISASLNDLPFEEVLAYVCESAGVGYNKRPNGTYVVGVERESGDNGAGSVGVDQSHNATGSVSSNYSNPAPKAPRVLKTEKVKLEHSTPSELLRVIIPNGRITSSTSRSGSSSRSNSSTSNNPRSGNIYISNGNGALHNMKDGMSVVNSQPVIPTIDPSGENEGTADRNATSTTGAGQVTPPSYGPPGAPPGVPSGVPGTNPTNTNNQTTSNTSDTFLLPDGIEDIRPFDLDNSLIVKGEEDAIEEFKRIIRMLDVPPKQVEVKAEFVQVSRVDIKSFGIDWQLSRLNEAFATNFSPGGNVVFDLATGNLTAKLRAQLTNTVGRIIQAPLISTINNQPASISIGSQIPYKVPNLAAVGDTVIENDDWAFINVDSTLFVTPRVNGDGTITLMLQPQISNASAPTEAGAPPAVSNQTLVTQRRVANGETIVVGGFISKEENNSVDKIPILGDLPIIGSLFRTSSLNVNDSELLIFITPTIIPDPSGGGSGVGLLP